MLPPTPVLTLALGIATVEAIAQATGITCDLRWPNDLMLDNRKAAGILVQLVNGQAIAGIGINVNHTGFPGDIDQQATSLRRHAGRELSREDICSLSFPLSIRSSAKTRRPFSASSLTLPATSLDGA